MNAKRKTAAKHPAKKRVEPADNPFSRSLLELVETLGVSQEAFADAAKNGIRRTEINRAINKGANASTIRWARGIAAGAGVSLSDACAFIETLTPPDEKKLSRADERMAVETLIARRGASSDDEGVALPEGVRLAAKRYARARNRITRPATLAFLRAYLASDDSKGPAITDDQWLVLITEVEGALERFQSTRAATPVAELDTATSDVSPT